VSVRPSTSTLLWIAAVVAIVLLAVWANVAYFTWLYAPVMLAIEFTAFVFVAIAAIVVRNSCLCPPRDR
jgi:hypothetical protein